MKKTRYPAVLFILGIIEDFFVRYFFLSFPAIILLVIGIWVKPCKYVGLGLILLSLVLCIIERIKIKKAMETESDNPAFGDFQQIIASHGWRAGAKAFLEKQTQNSDPENEGK